MSLAANPSVVDGQKMSEGCWLALLSEVIQQEFVVPKATLAKASRVSAPDLPRGCQGDAGGAERESKTRWNDFPDFSYSW